MSFKNWRHAVRVGMAFLIFEGACAMGVPGSAGPDLFRQGVSSSAPTWDLCAIGLGVSICRPSRRSPPDSPWRTLGLLETLNPNLPNLLVGILASRLFLLCAADRASRRVRFRADLARFLRRYVLIAIRGLAGGLQFFSPAGSDLNAYAWGAARGLHCDLRLLQLRARDRHVLIITGFTSYLQATMISASPAGVSRGRCASSDTISGCGHDPVGMMMSGSRGPC